MMQVTNTAKISQEVMDLVAKLAPLTTLDKSTGIATVEEGTYVKLLPEGLTQEMCEQVQDHTKNMVAAALHTLGTVSIPAFKSNKDLTDTYLSVPMIKKDSIEVKMNRVSMVPGKDADGKDITRESFGTTSVKIDTYGVGKRGDLKKIKEMMAEEATKALGK